MKLRNILLPLFVMAGVTISYGQAKKPTLMVIPSEVWCNDNGYMTRVKVQGKEQLVPDYERAAQQDMDLLNLTTKVGELMADRGFPIKDLGTVVRGLKQGAAEDEMTTSKSSGASLSESPLERLLNRAKSDIVIELTWRVNTQGPKTSITYNLRGLDAYTYKQIAAAQGTGKASFSAEIPVLLEEAVIENMDNFLGQLQDHFDDLLTNGREVTLNVRIFDNGSGASFEDEYNGEELTDVIEEWMAQNTQNHRFSLTDATENVLHFEQVRIPLYRENGMPMDTRHFANALRKYLSKAPYNITSKVITKGLGHVDLILGEK